MEKSGERAVKKKIVRTAAAADKQAISCTGAPGLEVKSPWSCFTILGDLFTISTAQMQNTASALSVLPIPAPGDEKRTQTDIIADHYPSLLAVSAFHVVTPIADRRCFDDITQ